MAQHRQTEQDAQQTETKLFLMFLFERIKQKGFKSFIGFGYKNNSRIIYDKFTTIHVKSPLSLSSSLTLNNFV